MIDTLRSEWIKLRTVRMNAVLAIIAVAFPLLITVLTAALIDADDMDAADLIGLVTGTSLVTGLLLGVIGAVGITSEFGFGTIRPTFAATPKRTRVVVAKSIVTVVVAASVQAVTVAVCFLAGAAILNAGGGNVSFGDAGDDRARLAGIVCFAAIASLLGLGLGLLIRNTPAAVAVLLLWPLVGELLISGLFLAAGVESLDQWLPFQAGYQLWLSDGNDGGQTLGRWTGGLYFLAVTAAVTAFGALSTSKRDA